MAYAARAWSCSFVLGRFSHRDDVPYARFDYHGIGAVYGMVGALIFAGPLVWLAVKLLFSPQEEPPPSGSTLGPHWAGSIAVALAIAAPSQTQIDYLMALPFPVMWPVAASAVLWFGLVVRIWMLVLKDGTTRRLSPRVRHGAGVIAMLITLPKLMLLITDRI